MRAGSVLAALTATAGLALLHASAARDSPVGSPSSAPQPASQPTPAASMPSRPDWQLVWSEEFDRDGMPDPSKWTYEVGFVRNREKQYYTQARKENARVEHGMLVIEGRKEGFPNARHSPAAGDNWRRGPAYAEYTSSCLTTDGKASWTFGRIEIRAKLPHGKGVWPAIWTLGTNIRRIGWPRCGEIDIMEFVGKEPDKVHATVHFGADGRHRSKGGKLTVAKPWEDFHVYAVEWWPDRIDFFFDETKYFTFSMGDGDSAEAFRRPHYLLLNLALGGSWGGAIDDSVLPQQFLVDYVRVYRHRSAATGSQAKTRSKPDG